MKRSVFFKIMGLILVFFVLVGAEKKKKPKKIWLGLKELHEVGLSEDQVKKIQALESYKKMNTIRDAIKDKGLKMSSDEAREYKADNDWKSHMKEFKSEYRDILTDEQNEEMDKLRPKDKKKKKKE